VKFFAKKSPMEGPAKVKSRRLNKAAVLLLATIVPIAAYAYPHAAQSRQKSPSVSRKTLTGLYLRSDGSELDVLQLSTHAIKFAIAAVGPYSRADPAPAPSTGSLIGTVTLVGKRAVYRTAFSDGTCHVTFQFSGSKAILSQGDSDCDFGAGVDISGTYQKKNSCTPKPETFTP